MTSLVANKENKRKIKRGKNYIYNFINLQEYNLLAALCGKLWEKSEILPHLSQALSSLHCETKSHLELHRHIFSCS